VASQLELLDSRRQRGEQGGPDPNAPLLKQPFRTQPAAPTFSYFWPQGVQNSLGPMREQCASYARSHVRSTKSNIEKGQIQFTQIALMIFLSGLQPVYTDLNSPASVRVTVLFHTPLAHNLYFFIPLSLITYTCSYPSRS